MITYDFVKALFKRFGYRFFTQKFDLNVCCFRNPDMIDNNVFNDLECIAYIDEAGRKRIEVFPCTVDPGITSLMRPINSKGAAVVVPGYYRKLWRLGLHRGQPALVQVSPISVYRDANRDARVDKGLIDTGLFGINNHRCRTDRVVHCVDDFSAGCTAVPDSCHMDRIYELVQIQNKYGHGDTVSVAFFENITEPFTYASDVPFP